MFLAFVRFIDYREKFGLEDDLSKFTKFIKDNGLLDIRINTDYKEDPLCICHPFYVLRTGNEKEIDKIGM